MNEERLSASIPLATCAAEPVSEDEKFAWLRLIRTPQIGSVTFWELISYFGSANAALNALPDFERHGARFFSKTMPSRTAVEQEFEKARAGGMSLVALGEPGYPPLLAVVEMPPPLLYIKGNAAIWDRPPVAIVGSRQASAAGLKFAGETSAALANHGYLIVSGLARGIDAAAHRAALSFATCAILPGGLDTVYPPEHSRLAAEIAEHGLLVSECAPGFAARSRDFPRRNRIISGSSLGVLVVEGTERSGSLITARLAAEQNREVFAVPGHPYEPRASGTNRLIKEGATVTTGVTDIEEALQPLIARWQRRPPQAAVAPVAVRPSAAPPGRDWTGEAESHEVIGQASKTILELLSFSPIDVDELCRVSGLEARHLHAALLSLDLAGRIERRGLRQIVLRP